AVWVLPKDRVFVPMLEALHRCPVVEVPFVWDARLIEQRAREVEQAGFQFGYVPQQPAQPRALRTAVFEPNMSVVKSCVIPMLIADGAYRTTRATRTTSGTERETVAELHLLNTAHMQHHASFASLLNTLDLQRDGRVHLDHRHDFVGYMSQFGDAVIAHQWQNAQNIMYLDTLYGGYPLIHNSPWLGEVGYFYPGADIEAGVQQLLAAARHHDVQIETYRAQANSFLASLHPQAEHNVTAYAQRLLQVCPANH
ncbi:DUF2827 family protein, partial [Burkholderia ubonensis]|uniref:DUF2827 family protein n=1 Tax=Burkholderia ubonensis TaxID=101571 RepID=UPI000ABD6415